MKTVRFIAAFALLLGLPAWAQQWQQEVRSAAERKDFASASAIVEARLRAEPKDIEAHAWRARLLGWSGHLPEAEAEYRSVLQQAPQDMDVLTGLADVLTWEGKIDEALKLLERAPRQDAATELRRAHLLLRLNRANEARMALREVLRIDTANRDARTALSGLASEARHELRFGADTDRFNYTDTATAQSVTLTSHWDPRWSTSVSSIFYQRFGAGAQRVTFRVSRSFRGHSWVGVGGGGAHDSGVIPKREASLEIGHAFRLPNRWLVRGAEVAYGQQWYWFQGSKALVLSGTTLFYLPRDWTFTLNAGAARSGFHVGGIEWQPSGSSRLSFPVSSKLRANLSFAVGAENFAKADELGHFSARTFGGGLRWQFTRAQDVSVTVLYQDRSQARTQTTVGIGYGIRF